jgi:hypothetical protein
MRQKTSDPNIQASDADGFLSLLTESDAKFGQTDRKGRATAILAQVQQARRSQGWRSILAEALRAEPHGRTGNLPE